MSAAISPILDNYIQQRLTKGNAIMLPCESYRVNLSGPNIGLVFFGKFKRVALLEAANVLLDDDTAVHARNAIWKGFSIELVPSAKPDIPLTDLMECHATGITDLNGKEMKAIEMLIDNLLVYIKTKSESVLDVCLHIHESGYEQVCKKATQSNAMKLEKYSKGACV